MVAFECNRITAVSSGSTWLLSSSATIAGSSVSVPGPVETEVDRSPTPGVLGGRSGLVLL